MIEALAAYRVRRKAEEEQQLTKLIDAMRPHSSPAAIERWLINRLAEERAEWNAAEAVHALMRALRTRPAGKSLDTLRNEQAAAKCIAMFCAHFELADARDGWEQGAIGDPFAKRESRA